MEKKMQLSLLLDFYGELLKDKVRRATEMYYNDDLSLSEIAEDLGITRQGVRDLIKRGENNLYSYEDKLGLYKRFLRQNKGLSVVKEELCLAKSMVDSETPLADISKKLNELITITDKLIEEE
ncbi:MAG: DNA-binding protein [Oscillospiraceae bacterium]|nr:DNA-binding protein [Oscillospiraceae bacterium]